MNFLFPSAGHVDFFAQEQPGHRELQIDNYPSSPFWNIPFYVLQFFTASVIFSTCLLFEPQTSTSSEIFRKSPDNVYCITDESLRREKYRLFSSLKSSYIVQ